jgi:hypothetical protein
VALEDIYIGVDDAPAPLADVVAWLREYLGDRMGRRRQRAPHRQQTLQQCPGESLGWVPKYPSFAKGMPRFLKG